MTIEEAGMIWDYIGNHLDDTTTQIAKALNLDVTLTQEYIINWAVYSKKDFVEKYAAQ